jgi:hypothetical protein
MMAKSTGPHQQCDASTATVVGLLLLVVRGKRNCEFFESFASSTSTSVK